MKRPPRATLARWAIAAAILGLSVAFLPMLGRQAADATVAAALDEAIPRLEAKVAEERPDLVGRIGVALFPEDAVARDALPLARSRLERSSRFEPKPSGRTLRLLVARDASGGVKVGIAFDEASVAPVEVVVEHRAVSPWSVLPPLLAIVLAFATGRLIFSLLAAIVLGAALSVGLAPLSIASTTLIDYGWATTFTDPDKLWIFVFTTVLVGLVNLVTRAGGIQGVVDRITRIAKGPRSAQLVTYFLGIAVFFDDYANTILVGNTMRPLTDRVRVSREKLAWIVDSTSAPIAGVAVISTWIGYEVGLLGDLATGLGLGVDGYGLFFQALPFRFYCLFTLFFVLLVLLSGRDFGPMLTAERRAASTGMLIRPGSRPLSSGTFQSSRAKEGIPRLMHVALVPIGVLIAGVVVGLLWDGGGLAAVAESPAALFSSTTWRLAFGEASSTRVLGLASLGAAVCGFALVLGHRLLSLRESAVSFLVGMRAMWMAIAILTLAWGIKAACDDLGTSYFLVAGLRDTVSPGLLPLLVFLLASVVAFATGTSWGTMGILIPTAGPLAFHLAGPEGMFLSLAAVLDGAIFGDHLSPISDTTVMSSIASGSDHIDHVRTQAPYAIVVLVAAGAFGYLWNAFGWGYGLGWILGPGFLGAAIFLLGRNARAGLDPRLDAARSELDLQG
ncbi:MAG TPA: Na+/H+ antiporter NhaC family protein [Vulgatibacter sp.]|nr:Na+/H+ antiporter NhaC family protein [Vulgatibacter sp.]